MCLHDYNWLDQGWNMSSTSCLSQSLGGLFRTSGSRRGEQNKTKQGNKQTNKKQMSL